MEYEILPGNVLRIQQPKYEENGDEKAKDPKKGISFLGCITIIILSIASISVIPIILSGEYEFILVVVFFGAGLFAAAKIFFLSFENKARCIKEIIVNPAWKAITMQLKREGVALKDKAYNFGDIVAVALDHEIPVFYPKVFEGVIDESVKIFLITWRLYLILSNAAPAKILSKLVVQKDFTPEDANRLHDLIVHICHEIVDRVRVVNPGVTLRVGTQRDRMGAHQDAKRTSRREMNIVVSGFFMFGLVIGIPILGSFLVFPSTLAQLGEMEGGAGSIAIILIVMLLVMIFVCGPLHFHRRRKEEANW